MNKLIFLTPEFSGQVFELPEGITVVGREKQSGLAIPHSSVSADHCEILVYGDEVIVREHGSSNGTWVDGVRVNGQMPVKNRQILRFGSVETRLELPIVEVEETTDITAVHEHLRIEREAHAKPPPKPPVPPIHSTAEEELPDQTVQVRVRQLADPAPPPAPVPKTAAQAVTPSIGPRRSNRLWVFIAMLVIVILAVTGWWWWTRR